jgi:hypothetical protein
MYFIKKVLFVLCVSSFTISQAEAFEKMIIYFDVNKTLIASDKATGKSVDNVINHLLAERHKGIWEVNQTTPMSYEEYVKKVLVPGSSRDPEIKQKRSVYLDRFFSFLEETSHPLLPQVNYEYQALIRNLSDPEKQVFESFFRLISYLDSGKVNYSIVLRTFGKDLPEMKMEIERRVGRPFFDALITFKEGVLQTDKGNFSSPDEIYKFFYEGKHFLGQDDYLYWHTHGEQKAYGKPFYVDQVNPDVFELFFDDNLTLEESLKNIITPMDASSGACIPVQELVQSGQLVKVDPIAAALDTWYFIHFVEKALIEHSYETAYRETAASQ